MSQAWPSYPLSASFSATLHALRLALGLLCLLALAWPSATWAQASSQYTNNTSGAINDVTCGTGTELVRTFTAGSNVTITDVNIGVALQHTFRADLIITLRSPQGTVVTLMNAEGGDGDNLSDLFDDSASQPIVNHAVSATDSIAAVPPYSHNFRPNTVLSAFNGQRSFGTWTLTICDNASVDVGTFTRSDLYITGTTLADLSLAMTSSSAAPTYGTTFTYTLTAASAASSSATATGVTVSDVLPSGATYVSSTGTGTYNSATGAWSVGSLAAGGSASLTITATASGAVGSSVTNTAQITASSQSDPDSTVNNGVTSEDDYASRTVTIGANTINCPTGSTATGSGYASSGTSAKVGQIFWLDWTCTGTAFFNAGATVNKSWTVGDGMAITGQITSITQDIRPYTVGEWGGDTLQLLHAGLNPIGLVNYIPSGDPQFNLALSATLNGSPVSLRYVMGDAEDSDGPTTNESISATSNGTAWQTIETYGSITVSNSAGTTTIYDPVGGVGTAVVESTASALSLGVTIYSAGGTAAAFGFYAPYDFSDAPLTGTSYGAANHRSLPGLRMGAAVTSESAAYDSANASADADDGATIPALFRSQTSTINVAVSGPGKLSLWFDRNGDGDFGDTNEAAITDAVDGGSGDSDGLANGVIALALTPPANTTINPTIARLRFSSNSSAASSGLAGYGEVEDYQITVIYPNLTVAKTSSVVSDPVNGTTNPKAIPGATMRYCVTITNGGNSAASTITLSDALPGTVSYVAGTMKSGTSCAAAATVEDDNATGTDETDGFGASVSGSTLSGQAASLAVAASVALIYDVTVQ
ncbi:CshA/CshB family fibrillar adhesin-related protein [Novosphingobium sp. B 225]|uniref:CshA/CshB family fibrillar adhesin-related protein n=1 Tax=Novosphingobium sp. B 225 TaxID=1961849 RepID=UPI000B4B2C3E|nr:CshA/CshB family fibrillar adhesin-related protein [Novosphingobium sp. B 225]